MSYVFDRLFGWTVNHRGAVTLFILVMSGIATVGYLDPARVWQWIRPDPEAPSAPASSTASGDKPSVEPVSLSNSDAVLVVHSRSDQFFTSAGARALRHVVEELESLDYVRSVLWMDEMPTLNIFGLQEPLFPRAESSERRFAAARDRALAHPLIHGQLLSSDGRTLLLLINFDWLFVQSDEDCMGGLRRVAENAAAECPGIDLSFQVTGRTPIYITLMQTQRENRWKYQTVGYTVVVLMAVVLFRGLRAVLIVSMAPAMGVFWTLGMVRYLNLQDNPFNDVLLPVLLSMVGLTDGVHLMVEIRRQSAAGMNGRDAARIALDKVGLACFLTTVTTAIGFGSLTLAHHEIVKEFGWSCVLGVGLLFVAVVTVIPLACSTWLGRGVHVGHERGLVDRNLIHIEGLIAWVIRRARPISVLAIVLTLALFATTLTLRPDDRMMDSLPHSAEASAAMRHIDAAFGGLEFSEIQVHWSDAVAADSPEVLRAVSRVDDLLRGEQLIGHPLSIRNMLAALPGEGDEAERMSMLVLLPPPLKRAFYVPEERRATISFRVRNVGIARYGPVFERLESGLRQLTAEYPGFTFALEGTAAWRWRNLYQIVVDLASSLGSETLIIFGVLAIAYRSLRIGLIAMIPNLFPLALTGTLLVLAGQSLEIVTVCAFTICLGIAVDDTIHFLTRFHEERALTDNDYEAVLRAFTFAGTGMIMTTLVLVVGFATVMFSELREQRVFATMGLLTVSSALFGDLIILPALLLRFAPPRRKGEPPASESV